MTILSAGLNHPQGGQMQYEFYSGGTSYMVNVFLQSGTLYVPVAKTAVVFMIGGGGSGGGGYGDQDTGKGGGGAGGALLHTSYPLGAGNHRMIVGQGGMGRKTCYNGYVSQKRNANSGEDTAAFGAIARGGGMGGGSDNQTRSVRGGCGGGGGPRNSNSGWNDGSSSDQGSYSGWTAYGNGGGNTQGNGNFSGGGGGGIGGAGGNGTGGSNSVSSVGGAGGAGRDMSSYFGTRVGDRGWFGGGGGGGTYRHGTNSQYQAPPNGGGSNYGGGGYGAFNRESNQNSNIFAADYINALDGTGGGGGGCSEHSWGLGSYEYRLSGHSTGSGGSGVIIIRTPIS